MTCSMGGLLSVTIVRDVSLKHHFVHVKLFEPRTF